MITTHSAFIAFFFGAQCAEYRCALPQRLAQLESFLCQVLGGEAPADTLTSLERCAHSLAGSGATFGFAALGDAAKVLELAAKPLHGSAQALLTTVQTEVSRAVELLRRGLRGELFMGNPLHHKLNGLWPKIHVMRRFPCQVKRPHRCFVNRAVHWT